MKHFKRCREWLTYSYFIANIIGEEKFERNFQEKLIIKNKAENRVKILNFTSLDFYNSQYTHK